MNVQQLALRLLAYIGASSLDTTAAANALNGRGLCDGDLDAVCVSINGGLQEVFGLAPAYISERQQSEYLNPPTTVTLTVIRGSKVVSGFTTWAAWMEGCTIRTSGDGYDNELLSATALLRPYMGASGTISATVYADCIPIASTFKNVLAPVELPYSGELQPADSRSTFKFWGRQYPGSSVQGGYASMLANRPLGLPQWWFAESRYSETSASLPLFLHLSPMPSQAYPITFRVKVKPPTITVADIGDVDADPDVLIPSDWIESILLPMALKRFTAHPVFSNQEALPEIDRQYRLAKVLIESFEPQIATTTTSYAP